jgi:hypothetical protein
MSTLSSLLDFDEYPELKKAKVVAPVPFGDFFLLNLVDYAVFRLSPDGKVLDEYILPDEWIDKDYRVMISAN